MTNTELSLSYSSFFKCLCDARKKTCLQRYTQRQQSVRDFEVDGTAESEDMSEGDEIGNMFLCNPGGFEINNYLSCTRWSDTSTRCDGARHCQSYHLEMDYDFCRSKCIKLDWQQYPLEVRNFGKFPRFVKGSSCGVDATTNTNTDMNLTSESTTADNRSLVAAMVVGWTLVAILLGIIIVAYIIYRWRRSEHSGKPNPVNSGSPPTAGERTNEQAAYSSGYTVIDEDQISPTPSHVSSTYPIKALFKRKPSSGQENQTAHPAPNRTEASACGTNGYLLASGERNTPDQTPGPSDEADGYMILEQLEPSQPARVCADTGKNSGMHQNTNQATGRGEYAKLNGVRSGPAADVNQRETPYTYNKPETLFEERNKKDGNGR